MPELNPRVFSDLSYGLYIVSSARGEHPNAQLVNTVIQVTSSPPRVAVIINTKNLTHEYIAESRLFGVTVLSEDAPLAFFGPFGFRTGRDHDKFAGVAWKRGGATGVPLVTGHALSVLEARVIDTIALGTHTIFVADALSSEVLREGRPLTYHYYRDHLKGKSSVNAPTYVAPPTGGKGA